MKCEKCALIPRVNFFGKLSDGDVGVLVSVRVDISLDVAGVGRCQRVDVCLDDGKVLGTTREVGVQSSVVQAIAAIFLTCKTKTYMIKKIVKISGRHY